MTTKLTVIIGLMTLSVKAAVIPAGLLYDTNTTTVIQQRVNTTNWNAIHGKYFYLSNQVTSDRAIIIGPDRILTNSPTTSTELGYVNGVTSSIQGQLNNKITGPASAIDLSIPVYDSTTGKLLKDPNSFTISASGHILPTADNTQNIGATGTGQRLARVFAGTELASPLFSLTSASSGSRRTKFDYDIEGTLILSGAGTLPFTGIYFEDNTSAYGAIIHSNTLSQTISFMKGDKSAMTPVNTGKLWANGGIVTDSNPAFEVTQTWNDGTEAFTGLRVNVTNTASDSASRIIDIDLDGSDVAYMTRSGYFQTIGGIQSEDWKQENNKTYLSTLGIALASDAFLSFSSTTAYSSPDTYLVRDGAAILAMRNGANAQRFNIYGTQTDESNYERLGIRVNTSNADIIVEAAGTGTQRDFRILQGATEKLKVSSTAITLNDDLLFTDNTFDIGASGATRPRTLYLANSVNLGANVLISPAGTDGVLLLRNNGGTDFGRIQLGGTTASFPALKRSGAAIECRLADDSAQAAFGALSIQIGGLTYVNTQGFSTRSASQHFNSGSGSQLKFFNNVDALGGGASVDLAILRESAGKARISGGSSTTAGTLITGGIEASIVGVTTTYTMVATNTTVLADTSGAGFTVNLMAASGVRGKIVNIKKISSDGNTLTVDADASETIDGTTTKTTTVQYTNFQLQSDGTNWWTL